MSIPSFSAFPEIPQRSAPEADFDAKMYALFNHFATTHRAELLAFIQFLETNSTVIGAALNGTTIGLNTPAAAKFTDLEAPLLVLNNAQSGVQAKLEASASDLNVATLSDHPIDFRPNDIRSLLLQTNGDKTFYSTAGDVIANLKNDGRLGLNCTPNDHLHVHEPTNAPTVLRLSNNEGNARIVQDQFGNLTFNQNGRVAHMFDDYGRIDIYGKNDNNNHKLGVFTENLTFDNNIQRIRVDRNAHSSFDFLMCYSNNAVAVDAEFRLRGDGQAFADGSWSGGGADYAEFFEWSDGNASGDDRRGVSVVLDGAMIRPALSGEDPIGVISANPSVIGDADIDRWKEKYLRDAFGSYIMEDFEVLEWEVLRPTQDPETGAFSGQLITRQYPADAVPEGNVVPEDATRTTLQRRTLNPAWNPNEEYVPRSDRPEWATVGLMGKLRLRKGQPVAPTWIKMRDVSSEVEEWLIK